MRRAAHRPRRDGVAVANLYDGRVFGGHVMVTSDIRFGPSIRRVIAFSRDSTGQVTKAVLYKRKRGKKRQSRELKPIETFVRRAADGAARCAQSYVDRHRESNEKRRDGWVRDLNSNVMRAARKGAKRADMTRWMTV